MLQVHKLSLTRAPQFIVLGLFLHNMLRRFSVAAYNTAGKKRSLPKPSVLFESNHLLAINKPAGWRSIPNDGQDDGKCLLQYCLQQHTFLRPLHRLDQPCTGILLYGKSSKSASRIQSQWQQVHKSYFVVVARDDWQRNLSSSQQAWSELRGTEQRRNSPNRRETSRGGPTKGASVIMKPILSNKASLHDTRQKISALRYRTLFLSKQSPVVVLEVETNNGSKHVIRSLLACHGCPLVGDLRYGAPRALPDASVALHARRLYLPEDKIVLNLSQRTFVAPIPTNWSAWFGCREADMVRRESPGLENRRSDSEQGEL
jgi:23S rRNA pseudouridine1911/1915/1917 synthase